MPYIGVHHIAGAFTLSQQAEMVKDITDAVVKQGGEGIRPAVQIAFIETALWGSAGSSFTIEEVELNYRLSGKVTPARELIISGDV